jgi:hypothetical protein
MVNIRIEARVGNASGYGSGSIKMIRIRLHNSEKSAIINNPSQS